MSFHQKLESIQYNACLAITGAIRGTLKVKLYQELDLEWLQLRRWYRKLGMFYKILKSNSPQYLFKLLPENVLMLKEMLTLFLFNIKHNFYKYSSFPSSIIEWSNLDPKVCNSKNFGIFKNIVLNLLDPNQTGFLTAAILRGLDWSHGSD